MNKGIKLLIGLTLGLTMGYGSNISTTWAMTELKFHSVLQTNGLIKTTDLHDLTIDQANTYATYLASMYQANQNKNALSSLRILRDMPKLSSLRSHISIMVDTLSKRMHPIGDRPTSPLAKNKTPSTKRRLVLNIDYFYGVLRSNKLIPNKEIQALDDDELRTYIDYLLLKRKYDSTNQAVIMALKIILQLPRYRQFIGTKQEIFLYPRKNSSTGGHYHFGGVRDQTFYEYLQKGDIIPIDIIKKLNSEQLDIYIDYLKLRYKYFRIEDGDQRDNIRTTSAEKYLHKVLLIRSQKRTLH